MAGSGLFHLSWRTFWSASRDHAQLSANRLPLTDVTPTSLSSPCPYPFLLTATFSSPESSSRLDSSGFARRVHGRRSVVHVASHVEGLDLYSPLPHEPRSVRARVGLVPRALVGDVSATLSNRDVSARAAGRPRKGGGGAAAGTSEDQRRNERRREMLNSTIEGIQKDYGKGTVVALGQELPDQEVEFFPSGVLPLDLALGGGWPRGRLVEIFGLESSGKSTLALYAIAQIQKMGEIAVLIDAEHALDLVYAHKLGVVTEGQDRLIVVQPDSGEDAFMIAERFIRTGIVSLVVVDSVSALVPKAEFESNVNEGSLAGLARLMSNALKRLGGPASQSGCTVMFLNQIRHKVGIQFGPTETTTGGMALKFYSSIRCQLYVTERKRLGTVEIGFRSKVRVAKSKVYIPHKTAEFDVVYGEGIPHEPALLDSAVLKNLVEKKGAYYYINGKTFQGRDKAIAYLRENPEAALELEKAVRKSFFADKANAAAASEAGTDRGLAMVDDAADLIQDSFGVGADGVDDSHDLVEALGLE